MSDTKTATKRTAGGRKLAEKVWTAEERAAVQAATAERKRQARRDPAAERQAGEADLLASIAKMPEPDRAMAERMHALVTATAPSLMPRTYYGMPAYAREGKTLCFFKPASKFKERYATFGFEQSARLDDGTMWPTSWALTELTADDEKQIAALVEKAVR